MQKRSPDGGLFFMGWPAFRNNLASISARGGQAFFLEGFLFQFFIQWML